MVGVDGEAMGQHRAAAVARQVEVRMLGQVERGGLVCRGGSKVAGRGPLGGKSAPTSGSSLGIRAEDQRVLLVCAKEQPRGRPRWQLRHLSWPAFP